MTTPTAKDLNWVNVHARKLTGRPRTAYANLVKARQNFKQVMEDEARRSGAISEEEALTISHKRWGFGMAKVVQKEKPKDQVNGHKSEEGLFASL
jgi:hypothetical protein